MATLSWRDINRLDERGIKVDTTYSGQAIELSPKGLAWLFNYLLDSKQRGRDLTLKMLKDVAAYAPTKDWRDLCYRAVECPVYDGQIYYSLVFYLEASAPKMFTALYPEQIEIGDVEVPADGIRAFRPRAEQRVYIVLSEDERARLKAGEVLVAN